MADLILKNADGKIWKNSDGKVLKARKMSQTVIQNGLAFWGAADPNFLTLVDGLVSEAYDLRETNFGSPVYGKLSQSTVAYRAEYSGNILNSYGGLLFANGSTKNLNKTATAVKSAFIVAKSIAGNGYQGIGTAYNYTLNLTSANNTSYYLVNNGQSYYYQNLNKRNASFNNTGFTVLHTFDNFNTSGQVYIGNIVVGSLNLNIIIVEWGWYNRLLNETEVIYNQNALMKKYGIT